MKTVLVLFTVLVAQLASAEVKNSAYEARHLSLIEQSVQKNCEIYTDLTQVSSTETVVRVDQGIQDVYFTTVLEARVRFDQGVWDDYTIIVESVLADAYDHSSQNWGIYSVNSVKCEVK